MEPSSSPGGAYGVQVLIAGRQKQWRDEVSSQIRRAGFVATTVDCGVDAMTVLALGLPVDVLVTDVSLQGELCCRKLAQEARALRPDLRIVFASDLDASIGGPSAGVGNGADDATLSRTSLGPVQRIDHVASTVRDVLRGAD